MKIDGSTSNPGTPANRLGGAKAAPKEGGKSFGAALRKAAAALPKAPPAPAVPVGSAPVPTEASSPVEAVPAKAAPKAKEAEAAEPAVSAEDHMETIKFRLKTGYYNSKSVDDALTEKLTGFFDELA
jgi:hypothetical protein